MPSQYYEQGRRDAQHGEFNQLFYHTYLDYKRGYDEVINGPPKRRPNALYFLIPLILLLGAGAGWLLRDRGVISSQATPLVIVVTPTVPRATPTFPPFVIATPEPPTATPVVLQIGIVARIATDGGVLRVRPDPSLQREPIGTLTSGTKVKIIDGPRDGDQLTWWQIDTDYGPGWVAEKYLRAGE